MATESITKSFVVSGRKQAEKFANAIEESYQESLKHKAHQDPNLTYIKGHDASVEFLKRFLKEGNK